MPIHKLGKTELERTLQSSIETLLDKNSESQFSFGDREAIDARQRRITNVRNPVEGDDAVTKEHLDLSLRLNFSMILFSLKAEESKEFFVFQPYGSDFYEFPFYCSIQYKWSDFYPSDVEVYRGDSIIGNFFDGAFHSFSKGSRLGIKNIGGKNDVHLEVVVSCNI